MSPPEVLEDIDVPDGPGDDVKSLGVSIQFFREYKSEFFCEKFEKIYSQEPSQNYTYLPSLFP